MSARALAVFLGVLAVIGLLGYGLLKKNAQALGVGDPVPATQLPRLDGHGTGSLADYRGRWVLVNVWASWCIPCRDEAPLLERYYRAHRRQGLVVLGIDTQDNSQDGLAFASRYGLTYPLLHTAGSDLSHRWGVTGYPETFLIDRQGRVVDHFPGAVTGSDLTAALAPLLGKASA